MRNLVPLVRGYLESAGFNILRHEGNLVVADKLLMFGQDRDTWVVWAIPPGMDISQYESTLRGSISKIRDNYPDANACILTPTRSGFSRDLLQTLTESRVKLLVPIQFFDTAFKHEEA